MLASSTARILCVLLSVGVSLSLATTSAAQGAKPDAGDATTPPEATADERMDDDAADVRPGDGSESAEAASHAEDADAPTAEIAIWRPAKTAWRLALSLGATTAQDVSARFYSGTGYLPALTLAAGYQFSRPYSADLEYELMSTARDSSARLNRHVIALRGTAVLLDRVPIVDPYVTARLGVGVAQQVIDVDLDELRGTGVGVDATLAAGLQAAFGEQHRYIGFVDVGYRFSSATAFKSATLDGFGRGVDLGAVSLNGTVFRVGLRIELDRR